MRKGSARFIILITYTIILATIIIGLALLTLSALRQQSEEDYFSQLLAINRYKKNQLETHFSMVQQDLAYLAEYKPVRDAIQQLNQYAKQARLDRKGDINPSNLQANRIYKAAAATLDSLVKNFCTTQKYNHFYYISAINGHILYSLEPTTKLGLSLAAGSIQESELALFWKQLLETAEPIQPFFSDFILWDSTEEQLAMFAVYPVLAAEKIAGHLLLPVSLDQVNGIMQQRTGLGASGESLLVGEDRKLRSDSFLNPNKYNVYTSHQGPVAVAGMDTETVRTALQGKTGVAVTQNINGTDTAAAWDIISFSQFRWVIFTEINLSEVSAGVKSITVFIIIIAILIFIVAMIIFTFILFSIIKAARQKHIADEFDYPDVAAKITIQGSNIKLPVAGKITINDQQVEFKELIFKGD